MNRLSVFVLFVCLSIPIYPQTAPSVLVPHIAVGDSWKTTFRVRNPRAGLQEVKIEVFDVSGAPLPVDINGQRSTARTFVVPAANLFDIKLALPGGVVTGFARMTFLSGLSLPYILFYSDFLGREGAISKATQGGDFATDTIYFDNVDGASTGIAFNYAAHWSVGQTEQVVCYGPDGVQVDSYSFFVPPSGLAAGTVTIRQTSFDLESKLPGTAKTFGYCRFFYTNYTGQTTADSHQALSLRFYKNSFIPLSQ
ncbi:MAG: hypothetical protein J0H49_11400 [Acidobacteria bacterium]|nr:hypothetical protein [Acidobacteriota bacterium]